jgi:hypothetical protein
MSNAMPSPPNNSRLHKAGTSMHRHPNMFVVHNLCSYLRQM